MPDRNKIVSWKGENGVRCVHLYGRVVGRWLAAAAPVKVGASNFSAGAQPSRQQTTPTALEACLKPAQVLSNHPPVLQLAPDLVSRGQKPA